MNAGIPSRRLAAVIVVLGLSQGAVGCDARQASAKRTVSRDLVDPRSAEWRDIEIVRRMTSDGGSISTVCGQVNSRNHLGGMAGFSRFAFVSQHNYPPSLPAGASRVLPQGVYDMEEMADDDLATRRNMTLDPFPRYDVRGNATMSALCSKSPKVLPSSLVDYTWTNPCENLTDGADVVYQYSNSGDVGSDNRVIFQVMQKFPQVPKGDVCRVLLSKYQQWTPMLSTSSPDTSPPNHDARASEILSEAVKLGGAARRLSEADRYF